MIAVLLFLLMRPGTVSTIGTVTFENPDYCAQKGSSVQFKCFYNYSDGETVIQTSWFKGEIEDGIFQRVNLSLIPSYQNRWEYRGDHQHNCSLALHDLQDKDTGYYFFRFDTYKYGWRSKGSVYLSVTGVHAEVKARRARAGDNVTLECRTSCHYPNIVWLRDGHLVTKPKFTAQAEDAGYYSCSIEGHESVQSDPVALEVWYSPLNVSIDVSHGEYLTDGSNVSLTCSSAANPAADTYTWYRSSVSSSNSLLWLGSGQVLTISPVEASHSGLYLCQAQNRLGKSNSTAVMLAVGEEGPSCFTVLRIGLLVIVGLLLLSLVIIWAWRQWRNSHYSAAVNETDSHDYENILSITEGK